MYTESTFQRSHFKDRALPHGGAFLLLLVGSVSACSAGTAEPSSTSADDPREAVAVAEAGILDNASWLDKYWSIQSSNYPDRYVRHRNFIGYIEPINTPLGQSDATFKIVAGLADASCVSFVSSNYPGDYLRHQNFQIKLQPLDPTSILYRNDATFCPRQGLADPSAVSFESKNYPGYFLRHRNFELWVETGSGGLFQSDATFKIVPPLAPH